MKNLAIILFLIIHEANGFNQFFQYSKSFFVSPQNYWGNMLGKKRYIFNCNLMKDSDIWVPEELHLYSFLFCHELLKPQMQPRWYISFKRASLLNPSQKVPFHQLGNQALRYITLWWVMGTFSVKPPQKECKPHPQS